MRNTLMRYVLDNFSKFFVFASVTVGIGAGVLALGQFFKTYWNCPSYDLSGSWEIETRIQVQGQKTYSAGGILSNRYLALLNHNCFDIFGTATKIEENGKITQGELASNLEIRGLRIDQSLVRLTFTEIWRENRNITSGEIEMSAPAGNQDIIYGFFSTPLAKTRGTIVAKRKSK